MAVSDRVKKRPGESAASFPLEALGLTDEELKLPADRRGQREVGVRAGA